MLEKTKKTKELKEIIEKAKEEYTKNNKESSEFEINKHIRAVGDKICTHDWNHNTCNLCGVLKEIKTSDKKEIEKILDKVRKDYHETNKEKYKELTDRMEYLQKELPRKKAEIGILGIKKEYPSYFDLLEIIKNHQHEIDFFYDILKHRLDEKRHEICEHDWKENYDVDVCYCNICGDSKAGEYYSGPDGCY